MNLSLKQSVQFLLIFSLIFVLATLFFTIYTSGIGNITNYTLPQVAIMFLIIFALKAYIMIIPAPALYLSIGIIFPPLISILLIYTGLILCLTISYFTGKKLGEKKLTELILNNKKTAILIKNERLAQKGLSFICFISRILPFPIELFSMFFGALKLPYYKFIFLSLAGLSFKILPIVLGMQLFS